MEEQQKGIIQKLKALLPLSWFRKDKDMFDIVFNRERTYTPRELSWCERGIYYLLAVVVAVILIICGFHAWLAELLIRGNDFFDNRFVHSHIMVGTFLFAFIISIAAWIIRTFDKKKEFYDSLTVRTDTLFIEFSKLALSGKTSSERAQGVVGLVKLKLEHRVYRNQVDRVTSSGINLDEARLFVARLYKVSLSGASLCKADLSGADLRGACLGEANLRDANMRMANLSQADLREANLGGADLDGANLSSAHLYGTNLSGADLSGADLSEAYLCEAKRNNKTKFPEDFVPPDDMVWIDESE